MQISGAAFDYYDQSKFLPKTPEPLSATRSREIGHHDWQLEDMFRAHLGPAISAMNTPHGRGRGGSVAENLHFVLARVPNHPKALSTLVDYAFIIPNKPQHPRLFAAPECYLERASIFSPKDPVPPTIYGRYLFKLKRFERALGAFEQAVALNPRSAENHYNLGLTLFKLGNYEQAREAAKLAYDGGYPLPGLRKMLSAKGFSLEDG